ncbi:MAG: creatininase family protein [Defluviitaleaceae bacterium]|nr:creatininase family protein [Defluviitaleaceae bacterium]
MKPNVHFIHLKPHELAERIADCPLAYLPLGTLEYHSYHLPLGADGMQADAFFTELAESVGGVVLPMLFLGTAQAKVVDGAELHGSDIPCGQILPGSLYRISDELFAEIIENIAKLCVRTGFKALCAFGHGPSNAGFYNLKDKMEEKYGIKFINCWHENPDPELLFMADHAAVSETSVMLHYFEDLVDMTLLPKDLNEWPLAVSGNDPRLYASKELGKRTVECHLEIMKQRLNQLMESIK